MRCLSGTVVVGVVVAETLVVEVAAVGMFAVGLLVADCTARCGCRSFAGVLVGICSCLPHCSTVVSAFYLPVWALWLADLLISLFILFDLLDRLDELLRICRIRSSQPAYGSAPDCRF